MFANRCRLEKCFASVRGPAYTTIRTLVCLFTNGIRKNKIEKTASFWVRLEMSELRGTHTHTHTLVRACAHFICVDIDQSETAT